MKRLQERAITQVISPEYYRDGMGYDTYREAIERCREELQRLEDNYEVVAEAKRDDSLSHRSGASSIKIVVIPKNRASEESIKRGLQDVTYRMAGF